MTKGNMLCGKKKLKITLASASYHIILTRNMCIVGPPEARGRPLKCRGWKGGGEME